MLPRRLLVVLALLALAFCATAIATASPAASPPRLSLGAQRRMRAAQTVASGWQWFRAALLLFFGPPVALLIWSIYMDPGTPIVLRMLHARALEVAGWEPSRAELEAQLRNAARRVRRWELGAGAEGAPAGAVPAAAEGRGGAAGTAPAAAQGAGLRARPPAGAPP
jgi:hypothetical protein